MGKNDGMDPQFAALLDVMQGAVHQLQEQRLGTEFAALSRRTPKRREVLFFGRSTFSDNSKYLYLKALSQPRDYAVRWCSHDNDLIAMLEGNGLPCLHLTRNMDATIDALMHCAVAVFCVNPNESLKGSHSLYDCLDGAMKVQLWHGVSVKHLLLQLIPHLGVRDLILRRAFYMASGVDRVLSTASTFDAYWREVFGCQHLVRAGFPRNEVLLRPATAPERLGAELPPEAEASLGRTLRHVLVVPTWQRGRPTWLTQPAFFTALLDYARRRDVCFYFKLHPMFTMGENKLSREDRFRAIPSGTDLYPWLSRFDAMVTDYSSIMFDFLHVDRPVLTLDLGQDTHRTFEPDWSLVPDVDFRHRFTAETFHAVLDDALERDTKAPGRAEMARRCFESDPTLASEHLLQLVGRLVEQAMPGPLQVDTF